MNIQEYHRLTCLVSILMILKLPRLFSQNYSVKNQSRIKGIVVQRNNPPCFDISE